MIKQHYHNYKDSPFCDKFSINSEYLFNIKKVIEICIIRKISQINTLFPLKINLHGFISYNLPYMWKIKHKELFKYICVFLFQGSEESSESIHTVIGMYVVIATNFATDLKFIAEAPILKCLQNEKATSLNKNNLCSYASKDKIYDDS